MKRLQIDDLPLEQTLNEQEQKDVLGGGAGLKNLQSAVQKVRNAATQNLAGHNDNGQGGDITGDGIDDIIVGAGPGAGPRIF